MLNQNRRNRGRILRFLADIGWLWFAVASGLASIASLYTFPWLVPWFIATFMLTCLCFCYRLHEQNAGLRDKTDAAEQELSKVRDTLAELLGDCKDR